MIKAVRRETNKEMRQKCQICDSKFQMLINVQHLCKRCHRYICEKCAPKRIKIYQAEGHSSIHKCCSICIKEEDIISNYIIKYRLVFGQNSIFADEWFKKLNKEKISYNEILNEYNEKIFATNSNIIRFKSESNTIFSELCAGQNYSMRQFTGRLIDQVDDDTIKQKVSNTIISIYSYLKEMPFNYQLVYMVNFLLCFCNEMNCYFIVTRFIEKVFPQYLKIEKVQKDNILNHELKMIIDMYKVLVKKIEKEEIDKIVKYLQKKFTTFTKSFLVNIVSVSASFYLIDQMFKNASYIYLYKSIAAVIFISRQTLYQERDENIVQAIEVYALKHIEIDQIKSSIINFQKSSIKFEMDHEFFDSAQHRKLHEKYKQLQNMYQKSQQTSRALDSKYSSLLKKYDKINMMYAEENKKVLALQEQLLGIADKLIMIQDIEKFKEENSIVSKKNSFLIEESSRLKKQLEDMRKREFMFSSQKFIFEKVKEDYNREIVDLKTKNEFYEIQKQINNQIDFNTSVIEEKIATKNNRIAELQKVNNQMQMEIDFYRQTRPTQGRFESPFNSNMSMIQQKANQSKMFLNGSSLNLSSVPVSSLQEKDKFKKYLQMSKEMTEQLKSQLSKSQSKATSLQKQVKRLQQSLRNLQASLELNKEINVFINQIPQEISYSQKINDVQLLISKENNIHKKSELQEVLACFKKCVYEVRYRTIDAKLKEKKIGDLVLRKGIQVQGTLALGQQVVLVKSMSEGKQQPEETKIESDEKVVQLDQLFGWMGKQQQIIGVNRSSIKREECQIM